MGTENQISHGMEKIKIIVNGTPYNVWIRPKSSWAEVMRDCAEIDRIKNYSCIDFTMTDTKGKMEWALGNGAHLVGPLDELKKREPFYMDRRPGTNA